MPEQAPRQKLSTEDRVMLLLSLVSYLREHGPTTIPSLVQEFHVDAAELRSLVQFLGTAGVPGASGCYLPQDLFDIDWDAFEQDDIVQLTHIVAIDDTPRFSNLELAAMLAGLQMLQGMLPEEFQTTVRSTMTKLSAHLPTSDTAIAEPPLALSASDTRAYDRVVLLTEAVTTARRVSFAYEDNSGQTSSREVEPLQLKQAVAGWQLNAYCLHREAERTFRVDRMRDIQILGEIPQRTDRPDPTPSTFTDADLSVTFRVRSAALHRIADFAPKTLRELEPGVKLAQVSLLHPSVAVRLVQAAPGELEILEPASAREAVAAWAAHALAQYDSE